MIQVYLSEAVTCQHRDKSMEAVVCPNTTWIQVYFPKLTKAVSCQITGLFDKMTKEVTCSNLA